MQFKLICTFLFFVSTNCFCQEKTIDHYSNYVIDLELKNNKSYEVYKAIDCLYCRFELISSGKIVCQNNDTIILEDDFFNNHYAIRKITQEKLVVIDMGGFKVGEFIYLISKRDSMGRNIFSGGWENGKKEGDWIYYQRNGRPIHTIVYKKGEVIDTIIGGRKVIGPFVEDPTPR